MVFRQSSACSTTASRNSSAAGNLISGGEIGDVFGCADAGVVTRKHTGIKRHARDRRARSRARRNGGENRGAQLRARIAGLRHCVVDLFVSDAPEVESITPPRITVVPFPVTSQANPKRGPRSLLSVGKVVVCGKAGLGSTGEGRLS